MNWKYYPKLVSKCLLFYASYGIHSRIDEDIDNVLSRLEKISSPLATLIRPAIIEIQNTLQFATSAGVSRQIFFHPFMLGSHQSLFKDGVVFEVVRRNKRMDVLAAGGRCA